MQFVNDNPQSENTIQNYAFFMQAYGVLNVFSEYKSAIIRESFYVYSVLFAMHACNPDPNKIINVKCVRMLDWSQLQNGWISAFLYLHIDYYNPEMKKGYVLFILLRYVS